MQPAKPIAFSYIRFSTPEQAMGDSERRQIEMAQSYADRHGLELDTLSFTDLGISAYRGKNAREGALRALLDRAEAGDIPNGSVLIVESMDRLSRTIPRKAVRILEDLCESGLTVVTLDNGQTYSKQSLNNEPYAFLIAYMVAIRANEESARKGRRVAEAWASKRKRAAEEKLTALCPRWMELNGNRNSFEIIPERAKIVRRVIREALEGRGQERIARGLNEEGVPTFGDGERWHKSTIAKLIRNPAVVGRYQPHMMVDDGADGRRREPAGPLVEGYYPAVVSIEDFAQLQARLADKRAPYVRTGQTITNPLAGLARCGLCGSSMTQVNKGRGSRPRLVCSRAKVGAGCEYHSIHVEEVWHALRNPRLTAEAPYGTEKSQAEWDRLEAERIGQSDYVTNLVRAIAEGGPSIALRAQLTEAERLLADINRRSRALSERMAGETPNSVQRRLAALQAALEEPDIAPTELNARLRESLSSVIIDPANPAKMLAASITFKWLHGGETDLPLGGFGAFPISSKGRHSK